MYHQILCILSDNLCHIPMDKGPRCHISFYLNLPREGKLSCPAKHTGKYSALLRRYLKQFK